MLWWNDSLPFAGAGIDLVGEELVEVELAPSAGDQLGMVEVAAVGLGDSLLGGFARDERIDAETIQV